MQSQYLFAYGTLKSDQPEHAQHCSPPISIKKARARGTLWRLREGYPILQVEASLSLFDATNDTSADWSKALELQGSQQPAEVEGKWIEGELFEYPLSNDALRRMDEWENFAPGLKSAYQRRIIWIQDAEGNNRVAWAYVCFSPPNWATMLSETAWNAG